MFTGIVECAGKVTRHQMANKVLKLIIDAGPIAKLSKEGDSIAVNGVCLTITKKEGPRLHFDMVAETLMRSNLGELKTENIVNLERAIRAGEPFGGHFVQGHIDTVGKITGKYQKGESYIMAFAIPKQFHKFLMEKGSVAIDGISLTITEAKPSGFSVAVIPYTLKHTTLGKKTTGDKVNIEVDVMGKWVNKFLETYRQQGNDNEGF